MIIPIMLLQSPAAAGLDGKLRQKLQDGACPSRAYVAKLVNSSLLGGELPTNRGCGLVHPNYKWINLQKSHVNHWV